MVVDETMPPEFCHEHCRTSGASHMAAQYSEECFCAISANFVVDRHGRGECDMPCTRDPGEICGGGVAFDLYEMEWAARPSSKEFLDRFFDKKNDGIIGYLVDIPDMTVELCREHCLDKDAEYYATRYSDKFWCGLSDELGDYDRHGEGVRHMSCQADTSRLLAGATMHLTSTSLKGLKLRFLRLLNPKFRHQALNFYRKPNQQNLNLRNINLQRLNLNRNLNRNLNQQLLNLQRLNLNKNLNLQSLNLNLQTPTFLKLLELHPLGFSDEVARVAQAYSKVLASQKCGQLEHSTDRNGYGENLLMCGLSRSDCYQAKEAMKGLYASEVEGRNTVTDYDGYSTAILWRATTEVGCGLSNCSKGGFDYQILVCDYNPPGNYGTQYEEQAGLPVISAHACRYN